MLKIKEKQYTNYPKLTQSQNRKMRRHLLVFVAWWEMTQYDPRFLLLGIPYTKPTAKKKIQQYTNLGYREKNKKKGGDIHPVGTLTTKVQVQVLASWNPYYGVRLQGSMVDEQLKECESSYNSPKGDHEKKDDFLSPKIQLERENIGTKKGCSKSSP